MTSPVNTVRIVVVASNQTQSGFSQIRQRMRQLVNDARVQARRMMNQFAARGGFGPLLNRMSSVGRQAGQFFVNNFRTIAMAGLSAAGAPIAATLLAAIAAALSAGILLAVGGGVLAAGIKAAAKDPEVKKAWSELGAGAKTLFEDFGTPFKQPLIRAASTFADTLLRIAPALNRMGQMMAPLVDKLAPAFAKMVENSLPGLEKAVAASIPLFEKLAEKLPEIGTAISKFFDKIAQAGPEATKVFSFLLSAISAILPVLGTIISGLARFYSTMLGFWSGVKDVAITAMAAVTSAVLGFVGTLINGAAKAFGWIPGIGPKLKQAAAEFNKFRDSVNAALDGIRDQSVNVDINYRTRGTPAAQFQVPGAKIPSGNLRFAAAGGVRSGLTVVGERGPELVDFNQGRVYNNEKSRGMVTGAGGGSAVVYMQPFVGAGAGAGLATVLNELVRKGIIQWRTDASGRLQVA